MRSEGNLESDEDSTDSDTSHLPPHEREVREREVSESVDSSSLSRLPSFL
jgi:hypothetical protein